MLFHSAYRGVGKNDKGKGKASDSKAKGKEKDPSLAVSDILDAQPDVLYPSGKGQHGPHEHEATPELLENVEEQEEDGNDEDVGMAEAEAETRN